MSELEKPMPDFKSDEAASDACPKCGHREDSHVRDGICSSCIQEGKTCTSQASLVAIDYAAATEAVKDLFGGTCSCPPPLGITLTPTGCGTCSACRRDWTPEARLIVDAALQQKRSSIT